MSPFDTRKPFCDQAFQSRLSAAGGVLFNEAIEAAEPFLNSPSVHASAGSLKLYEHLEIAR
jgi:hypothetical protein